MKAFIACVCLVVLPATLRASEAVKFEYYQVEGASARDLHKELAAKGPLGDDGVRYHGYTRWYVSWNFRLRPRGRTCEVEAVGTKIDTTITLPRWKAPDDAAEDLKRQWQRYDAALRLHEDGHHAIAVSAAREVERRLSGFSRTGGCEGFTEEVNDVATAALEDFRARELAYDATTGHGRTQGAWL